MSLEEILKNQEFNPSPRACGVKRLVAKLTAFDSKGEIKALTQMLADKENWSSSALGKVLASEGYGDIVTSRTIERHRKGACSCHSKIS